MGEIEVCVVNCLRESPNAVVQVMVAPAFATAKLELRPLRILNPGPNGGESAFAFRGLSGVAVRTPRGTRRVFSPIAAGEVVRAIGGRLRLVPDDLVLGAGRIGIRHALDQPQLIDVEWLVDDTQVTQTSGVNHRSVVSSSFDDALSFAAVLGPNIGDVERALTHAVRFLPPPGISRVVVLWDRTARGRGRDVFTFECS